MKSVLHIIASCTDRKRVNTSPGLRLRDIAARNQATRTRKWIRAVQAFKGRRVRAEDLYVGDHWVVIKSLLKLGSKQGFVPRLWVLSAGYGFIPAAAEIAPYSATFASMHPDSVTGTISNRFRQRLLQEWWASLSAIEIQGPSTPRTLTELAMKTPGAGFLVIASPTYLSAMEQDLSQARVRLHSVDQLIIVSSDSAVSRRSLGTSLLRTEVKLSGVLGGAAASLNARVARLLLRQVTNKSFSYQKLRANYLKLLARTPMTPPLTRTPMNDNQVRTLIRTALGSTPDISHTALLRSVRDNGHACEYRRFKSIYGEVKGVEAGPA